MKAKTSDFNQNDRDNGNFDDDRTEPVAIFILKSQEGSLLQAESFLRNRKWIVKSSTNLREALAYLVEHQPPYVMISSDHLNKKVQQLPKMLIQAFPVRVIGFAEKGSGLSLKALQELNLEYKLQPPVSGPAIERMILKIQKDDSQRKPYSSAPLEPLSQNSKPESEMMTFRGSFGKDSQSTKITSENLSLGGVSIPLSKNDVNAKGTQGLPQAQTRSQMHEGPSGWELKSKASVGPESPEMRARASSTEPTSGRTSNPKQISVMESEYERAKSQPYEISTPEEASEKSASLIVRGTEQALQETVNISETENLRAISKASNIACITVQSTKFSGYLVCALGDNRTMDPKLIALIQKRLFYYLRANGVALKESESLNLKVQEVEFTDWTLRQAQFLKKSIHNGDEIAIAFFPTTSPEIQLDPSAIEKMRKLSIQNLKEDVALEFDLYMYMPANNKYLLYTPRGMPFLSRQKKRLQERGITHMHLRKESAHQVTKYHAQIFLNEKIEAYKKARSTG